jgi:hypothetical protein
MREHIVNEIRRLTKDTGKVPGQRLFESETGVAAHQWRGKFWARWGDALVEAGFGPNEWTQKLDTKAVLDAVIVMCRYYKKVPTRSEVDLYSRSNPGFPGYTTIRGHFESQTGLVRALRERASESESYSDLAAMLPTDIPIASKATIATSKKPDGFVYLIKSGDSYKIGRSDDLERRVKEIRISLPDKASLFHTIRTDDPSGIEAYWHRRFEAKRANGEWFKLSPQDVAAFKKRKFQ